MGVGWGVVLMLISVEDEKYVPPRDLEKNMGEQVLLEEN